jgi:ATP-dependent DNA helicase MPH1
LLVSLPVSTALQIIECLIIRTSDEAHKARGDYAYAKVVRILMAQNAHFRVLALTATPGSDRESVQEIVNTLHISHIEIRDENSLDLRQYVHRKVSCTPAI